MRPVLLIAAAALVAATAACANQTLPTTSTPTVTSTTSDTAAPTATPEATTSAATSTTAAAKATPGTSDTVVYKVTGSGTATTIDWTPADADGAGDRKVSVPLPWTQEVPNAGKSSVYEVVIIGGDAVGCTITLNGKVVAQEPAGGTAHCIYTP